MSNIRQLSDPVELPCGVIFKNRLVKAAMAEHMSTTNTPEDTFPVAYKNWGDGGWGGLITGNVHVDPRYTGGKGDLTFANTSDPVVQANWRAYAEACHAGGAPAIVQICHPGRQSPFNAGERGFFEKNVAPSPLPMNLGDNIIARAAQKVLFGTPREMSVDEIDELVASFAENARFMSDMGFDGVELHAAHGYLLSAFMDEKLNIRTDTYGSTPKNRTRVITSIIHAIRAAVPSTFAVGIKLNSTDTQHSTTLDATLDQMAHVIDAGIDFLEISGGSYENPVMTGRGTTTPPVSTRTANREAYFLDFASSVRSRFPSTVLMVTGGFRSLAGMKAALDSGAADIIGIARPAVVDPAWAKKLLDAEREGGDVVMTLGHVEMGWLMKKIPVRALGAGAESNYYSGEIGRLGRGLEARAP
ncbi:putative FMN binding oxidoreductase [Paraphoma chrysanthemicola]|nr:putative FMN binding oxidoreductase [Paraphoma chrysanthemicola]